MQQASHTFIYIDYINIFSINEKISITVEVDEYVATQLTTKIKPFVLDKLIRSERLKCSVSWIR
jgi:hypothetical protein